MCPTVACTYNVPLLSMNRLNQIEPATFSVLGSIFSVCLIRKELCKFCCLMLTQEIKTKGLKSVKNVLRNVFVALDTIMKFIFYRSKPVLFWFRPPHTARSDGKYSSILLYYNKFKTQSLISINFHSCYFFYIKPLPVFNGYFYLIYYQMLIFLNVLKFEQPMTRNEHCYNYSVLIFRHIVRI